MPYRLVPLGGRHRLEDFECGEDSLDRYLRNEARRAQRSGESQTHVWEAHDGESVGAYFTIAPAVVSGRDVAHKRRPTEQFPVLLLAKLALCTDLRGQRLGDQLILDVLGVILQAANLVGGRFIIVDAQNNKVLQRYQDWDYTPIEGSYRLWMKVQTARVALESSAETGAVPVVEVAEQGSPDGVGDPGER